MEPQRKQIKAPYHSLAEILTEFQLQTEVHPGILTLLKAAITIVPQWITKTNTEIKFSLLRTLVIFFSQIRTAFSKCNSNQPFKDAKTFLKERDSWTTKLTTLLISRNQTIKITVHLLLIINRTIIISKTWRSVDILLHLLLTTECQSTGRTSTTQWTLKIITITTVKTMITMTRTIKTARWTTRVRVQWKVTSKCLCTWKTTW